MITWASLTGGLLGAVVGAGAVFGATVATLWRTRVGDRKREVVRLAERDLERRHRYVAEVIATFKELEREVRGAPFSFARSQGAFLRATMLFYMAEKAVHPAPAEWLLKRNDEYTISAAAWRRFWWCPVVGTRRANRVGELLGQVIAALVLWATGEVRDSAFDDAQRSPTEVARFALDHRAHA